MPTVRTGPALGMVAQLALLGVLAATVGLGAAGWVVGTVCGAVTAVALTRGLRRERSAGLGPADRVTLGRAVLVGGAAALVGDRATGTAPLAVLVTLSAVALALDAVDGWVARRTGTVSPLGARFDAEIDSLLILVLSAYVAVTTVWWALAIGLAHYAFVAAGWWLPWMRPALPPRYWGKVVAAVQGVTLTVAVAGVLPARATELALLGALALLTESFGRSVGWLWRRRAAAPPVPHRVRAATTAVTTSLALVVVWVALVAPDKVSHLTPGAFVRIPIEGLVAVALVLVLPLTARQVLAVVVGPTLGLLVLVRLLDMGFFATLDRPFNPVTDWSYAGTGLETLRESVGSNGARIAVVGGLLLVVTVLVVTTVSVLRVVRVATRHRTRSLRAVTALAVAWALCAVLGAQVSAGAPVASSSAAVLAYDQVRAVRTGVQDHAILADEITRDRFRDTPPDELLTGLRGKDVIVAFVESYGRIAVQGSELSPQVNAALDAGTRRLRAAGFSARTAFLTSPTFGGISWLAHSTLQSGVWIDTQRRYDQLMTSDRFTLNQAFQKAGWRTVNVVPSNNRDWEQGRTFYHWDEVYDRRNVGYRGPTYAYASMPDQFVLAAFRRLELSDPDRAPLMAELDLVSSHEPWTRIPRMLDWEDVGDGSIYHRQPTSTVKRTALWADRAKVRAAYGRSIRYSMDALVSFVQQYGDDDTVLVVLGDHQPATVVTGPDASHDAPISIIAHDPSVLDRISSWGWPAGLRPHPDAPVLPMRDFRDLFLTAYGPQTSTQAAPAGR